MKITYEQFLSPFFESGETVHLRVFDDKKGSTFKGLKLEREFGKISALEESLRKHNAQGRGIFFVVNYGGDKDDDITRVNAVFVENDNLSIEDQIDQLTKFPLPPSLMVKTAKSVHAYWLTTDVSVPEFRAYQRRLITQFDGDTSCVNESRVLRLPGFNHCKGSPVMVECIKFSPELRYTKMQLDAVLPKISSEESSVTASIPKATRKGLTLVGSRCDFIKHCNENAAVLPESLWYAMITNLAVFDGGANAIHILSKAYPKYSKTETDGKIIHFIESGTKPMTCAKIGECGFKCPRLADCGCKAPAALCYLPPDADTLRTFLSKVDVKGNTADDMETARDFVREYLYNVDSALAAAFVETELRERFNFKAGIVRPLVSLQKELFRAYRDNKETKRETEGAELPDWYEFTEKGGIRFLPGVLAEHMAKEEKIFYAAEQYYAYNKGVYSALSDLAAKASTRKHLIARYTTLSNITDADGQWRMLIIKHLRELNANPYIINVRNGLYNVLTEEFLPHTPDFYSTVQLNVNYTPNAECPRFKQFLSEALDEDDIPLVQEMMGYFLIPVNKAQKSFVIVGEPGAGKSKLLLTLNELLLGQENVSNIPWQSLNERFKTAELFGKLANIFADLPTKNIDDNGIFKALVGEDFLTAERKNKDPFSFQPYARLLFSCNMIPRNYGDKSEGFYRRLIIIRFAKPVPQERRDPGLLDKFATESDGIFMFAVEGLKRLIAQDFRFSETPNTKAELQRYRIDSNSVLSFIEDCCKLAPDAEAERSEIFEKYREYCRNAGLSPVSQKTFNKDIEMAHPDLRRSVDKVGKRRTWKGIRLDNDV